MICTSLVAFWGTWLSGREISEEIILSAASLSAEIPPSAAVISYPEWTWVDQPGTLKIDIISEKMKSPPESGDIGSFVEVRVDAPGIFVRPPGSLTQPLIPGKPVHFQWDLTSSKGGEWQGLIWIYYQLVNVHSGQTQQIPVLAKSITIGCWSLFGLSISTIRWIVISLLGIGIGWQILSTLQSPKSSRSTTKTSSLTKKSIKKI